MANVRRFLRYDVRLPVYLELCDERGLPLGLGEQAFLPPELEDHLAGVTESLNRVLEALAKESSASAYLLHQYNMRLNFLQWLLTQLAHNEDPKADERFAFRLREDAKIKGPELPNRGSKIGALLHGLFMHLDLVIKAVLEGVLNSHEKLFVFPQHELTPFDHRQYVLNLEQVAEKGSLLAQAVLLLEDKLNTLLKVFQRLQAFYRMRSAVDEWPVETVNLSAGGAGLWHDAPLKLFGPINVFLALDDGVFASRGKVVFCRQLGQGDRPWRVGIDFEWLPSEAQLRLTRFIQWRELEDTMDQFPAFPGLD